MREAPLLIDDQFVKESLDGIDLIQRLRHRIGDDPGLVVELRVSAWALDQLLGMAEAALRRPDGELE